MKKMLFLNIGWMERYQGLSGDSIENGGSYVEYNGSGHESCNFLPCKDGYCYGYVQVKTIDYSKHFFPFDGDKIDDVLVVWCATRPGGGRCIIGWFKNATLFRDWQMLDNRIKTSNHVKDGITHYHVRARQNDVTLLSVNDRLAYKQIKGHFCWYADSSDEYVRFRDEIYDEIMNEGTVHNPSRVESFANRKKETSERYVRQQRQFKKKLVSMDRSCVISKCALECVLEGAHVISVADGGPDRETNGILLRADIHCLFDAGLIRIDNDGIVHVSKKISNEFYYLAYDGVPIPKKTFERVKDNLRLANTLMDAKLKKDARKRK